MSRVVDSHRHFTIKIPLSVVVTCEHMIQQATDSTASCHSYMHLAFWPKSDKNFWLRKI